MNADLINQDNINVYSKFMHSDIPLDKYEHPDLDKQEFTALIKFLLTIVDSNEAIYLS